MALKQRLKIWAFQISRKEQTSIIIYILTGSLRIKWICGKLLKQCLAYRKYSINVSYYFESFIFRLNLAPPEFWSNIKLFFFFFCIMQREGDSLLWAKHCSLAEDKQDRELTSQGADILLGRQTRNIKHINKQGNFRQWKKWHLSWGPNNKKELAEKMGEEEAFQASRTASAKGLR